MEEKKEERVEYTDLELLPILNDFVFCLFLIYFLSLNIGLLIILPYLVKDPLTIENI